MNNILDGLGLVLPHPIKEQKFRASIASISTFLTTDSADAVDSVIHQTPRRPSQQYSVLSGTSSISTLSLSDVVGKHSVLGKSIYLCILFRGF